MTRLQGQEISEMINHQICDYYLMECGGCLTLDQGEWLDCLTRLQVQEQGCTGVHHRPHWETLYRRQRHDIMVTSWSLNREEHKVFKHYPLPSSFVVIALRCLVPLFSPF